MRYLKSACDGDGTMRNQRIPSGPLKTLATNRRNSPYPLSTVTLTPPPIAVDERFALFETMLTVTSELMLVVDASQRIVFANAAAVRAFGYAPPEFERLPLAALIPAPQRDRHAVLAAEFLVERESVTRPMASGRVVAACRKDGTTFPFEVMLVHLAPTWRENWVAAIGRDVSERETSIAVVERQAAELRRNALALQSLREAERGRIARELHDNLGQHVAGMSLDIGWLEQHASADIDGLDIRLRHMREGVDTALGTLRKLSADLRPLMLDDLGLGATLEWLAQRAWQDHGLKVDVSCTIEMQTIGEPMHSSLYRVAEEVLHYLGGGVRQASLLVQQDGDVVRITIRADGVPQRETPPDRALIGVRERAALLGGRLDIESPDERLTVRVSFPLPAIEHDRGGEGGR